MGVIPGGFVISILDSEKSEDGWYQAVSPSRGGPVGYVHESLLNAHAESFVLTEFENPTHKIKYFTSRWPTATARVYSLKGEYLGYIPQDFAGWYEWSNSYSVGDLESEFPYYSVGHSSNCCEDYRFFSKVPFMENSFDMSGAPEGGHGWILSEQGDWITEVFDDTYKYWSISEEVFLFGAIAPLPRIVLQLVNGKPVPSETYMRRPKLSKIELESLAARQKLISQNLNEEELTREVARVVKTMVRLIYAGNPHDALNFLDMVWFEGFELDYVDGVTRDVFASRLIRRVQSSPYYRSWMLDGLVEAAETPMQAGLIIGEGRIETHRQVGCKTGAAIVDDSIAASFMV